MRDVDCNFRCKLLVRKKTGIKAAKDLQGKTLALGSRAYRDAAGRMAGGSHGEPAVERMWYAVGISRAADCPSRL
jgi:hypothetical protein